ncbi:putative Xre family DNA-binding protein [Ilumatobacter coccineus YM16-304]|uniref:Putative Xre family DNA-binding protein n=2 Tax=Ilumatobacter coccineus TaxID=467094 RepID=A0A6C7E503_ILUCY|nr:putative Xre family DNA-binding protein [Ilumatobacter coccineus YM16-304]
MSCMDAETLIRTARTEARLSVRELARRAGTSHSTLVAYEQGRKDPTVGTLNRILRAADVGVDVTLRPRVRRDPLTELDRGDELLEVLNLAEMFPARHDESLQMPVFGRRDVA